MSGSAFGQRVVGKDKARESGCVSANVLLGEVRKDGKERPLFDLLLVQKNSEGRLLQNFV
jgi:hypothetical protein